MQEGAATCRRAMSTAQPAKRSKTSAAPPASSSEAAGGDGAGGSAGSLIAQFETAEGERTGPQLDVPLDTDVAQLALSVNQLLGNEEEPLPYSFYVGDGEVTGALGDALGAETSTEAALRIVYVPQAVFRVRAVTRCTSTLPGHAAALLPSELKVTSLTALS